MKGEWQSPTQTPALPLLLLAASTMSPKGVHHLKPLLQGWESLDMEKRGQRADLT